MFDFFLVCLLCLYCSLCFNSPTIAPAAKPLRPALRDPGESFNHQTFTSRPPSKTSPPNIAMPHKHTRKGEVDKSTCVFSNYLPIPANSYKRRPPPLTNRKAPPNLQIRPRKRRLHNRPHCKEKQKAQAEYERRR